MNRAESLADMAEKAIWNKYGCERSHLQRLSIIQESESVGREVLDRYRFPFKEQQHYYEVFREEAETDRNSDAREQSLGHVWH